MISESALARMTEQTRQLRAGFAVTVPQQWDATAAGAELTVQLGHLALCLARRHGIDITAFEDPARPIAMIGDELADVTLAALSIATLVGESPSLPNEAPTLKPTSMAEDLAALLILVAAAGQLAEAAMIDNGYRHQPNGETPTVPDAVRTVLASADRLAVLLGLELREQFEAMVADANRFLTKYTNVGERT